MTRLIPTLAAVLSLGAAADVAHADNEATASGVHRATDRLIVKWAEPGGGRVSSSAVERAHRTAELSARVGIPALQPLRRDGPLDVLRLRSAVDLEVAEAYAQRLAADPEVEYAQPDRFLFPQAITPNDSYFLSSQWSLHAPQVVPAGIGAEKAWERSTGDPALVIAVLDSGLLPHADLAGRYFVRTHPDTGATIPYGYDFVGVDFLSTGDRVYGTANDGDGRDPDPSDPGDWVTSSEAGREPFIGCNVTSSSWHGTHIAGIIAASADNQRGIAGIDWRSRLLPVRVIGKCGGYLSDIIDALRWAAGLPVSGVPANEHPARIINLSLGAPGQCRNAEQEAINDAVATGATVVVAAGNDASDASQFTPASCQGVLAVTAVDRNGRLASYGNFGSAVDIAAPGGDRWSDPSRPDGVFSTLDSGVQAPINDAAYATYIGTSMAAPHAVGVLSLMLAGNRALTANWLSRNVLITKLKQAARAFPSGTDNDCTRMRCGAGLLDAAAAVAAVTTPPVVATAVTPVTGPGALVTLDASPSKDDGRIVRYRWQQLGAIPVVLEGADTASALFTVPELPNGAQLQFEVSATDDVGLQASTVVDLTVRWGQPVFEPLADRDVSGGQTLKLQVSTWQYDGGIPLLSVAEAPTGARFRDLGAGRGELVWTPEQSGDYHVAFVAENPDDPDLRAVESLRIRVASASVEGTSVGGGGGAGSGLLVLLLTIYPVLRGRGSSPTSKPARAP